MSRILLASLALGALAACNLGPKATDNGDDPVDDTGDVSTDGATVQELQDGTYGEGDTVTLKGVLVASPWTSTEEGFFIQQPGGGEYSGIYVYMPGGPGDLYLTEGDEIALTGTVTEYYDWTEFSVSDTSAIEVTGTGTLTVDSVDPGSVSDWEVWESCLISLGASEVSSGVNSYGEVTLASGMIVDNLFYNFDTEQGATYTNVTGALTYSYSEWKLAPRSDADLEGYVPGEGPAVVTVAECQNGTVATDSEVSLEGVIVTSPMTADGEAFFVQDEGGGMYSGVYVYLGSGATETYSIGDKLDIEGQVIEYYDLTELSYVTVTSTGATGTPVSEVLSATPSDWEPLEGMLVTLTDVGITSELSEYGEVSTSYGDLLVDNCFHDFALNNGDTVSSLTGLVYYNFSEWKICPRDADDIVL